jgi:hypothetical protein
MPQTMKREDGTFSREDFTFDKDRNVYICPAYGWFTEGFGMCATFAKTIMEADIVLFAASGGAPACRC